MMEVSAMPDVLLWCTVINMGILLSWWLMFVFAHDWIRRFHGKWFKLSTEQFDGIHYAGMAVFKILIFVFNLVPLIALAIVG